MPLSNTPCHSPLKQKAVTRGADFNDGERIFRGAKGDDNSRPKQATDASIHAGECWLYRIIAKSILFPAKAEDQVWVIDLICPGTANSRPIKIRCTGYWNDLEPRSIVWP